MMNILSSMQCKSPYRNAFAFPFLFCFKYQMEKQNHVVKKKTICTPRSKFTVG